MKIVQAAVGDLKAHPKNSRVHSKEQIAAVARAIQQWGFTQPVVTNEAGVILIGHGRVEAAKALGMDTVPVLIRSNLTDAQERALIISDNRLAEKGSSWDKDVLSDELQFLMGEEFDITLTGFDIPEMKEPKPAADPVEAAEPISEIGDVWQMGRHTLYCGVRPIGAVADLIVTDWPVGSDVKGDRAALAEAIADVAPIVYLWHQPRRQADAAEVLEELGFEIRGQIIMTSEATWGGGARYARHHMPCWYAVQKGKTANWLGGRAQTTIWPTENPAPVLALDCWRRPLVNHTAPPDGSIYDPFAYRGTGLIAAHQTGRVFDGVEVDPVRCDAIVKRWEALTGQTAKRMADGPAQAED